MYSLKRNVTIEYSDNKKDFASNPFENSRMTIEGLSQMINEIINKEFIGLKNTSMLHDMVLYSLIEDMNTIQKMENVLSYMEEAKIKKISDISFKNGDINIKCSI